MKTYLRFILFFLGFEMLISLQNTYAQCPPYDYYNSTLGNVEGGENTESKAQKIVRLEALKKQFEACKIPHDSVYASILHRLGWLIYEERKDVTQCITLLENAVKINTSKNRYGSETTAIKSLFNLGLLYENITLYDKALEYFDKAIIIGRTHPGEEKKVLTVGCEKAHVQFKKGDYEKEIEEASIMSRLALDVGDSALAGRIFNKKAQAYLQIGNISNALKDVEVAASFLISTTNFNELADNYKIKADISAVQGNYKQSFAYHLKTIETRSKIPNAATLANDYSDAGLMLTDYPKDYIKAQQFFDRSLKLALQQKDPLAAAYAYNNKGHTYKQLNQPGKSLENYQQGIKQLLPFFKSDDALQNPNEQQCKLTEETRSLHTLLFNKAEALLLLYKQSGNKSYLNASINTSLLGDKVLSSMRHQQVGETSKLFWRNQTREFFNNAIEGSYLNNDKKLAFYFMEKSRAVLLNDKLNEIGASIYLPKKELDKEQEYQVKIFTEQQKLKLIDPSSPEYSKQEQNWLQLKSDYEDYTKSLEKRYPAYYQYRYKDDVPELDKLKKYLAVNHQHFVHYFIGDTVSYVLSIGPTDEKMIRVASKDFRASMAADFLQRCSNENLNNNYPQFATLSYSLYKSLFEPLQIPKGRVVICPDNFLLPFEALSKDANGKQFLINDYAFSYVYSARYLMKDFNSYKSKGNFIGFAPVSFLPQLKLPDLKKSADALKEAASFYNGSKLITRTDATKNNFLDQLKDYRIANIFSHAIADSSVAEPSLFMYDSVIELSALQLLNQPATQLVVLSACQTNVGKNATGEGIYSLARGFASVGIPSIAATLWSADENMIYTISKKFNEYLSKGMSKDEALQHAKLDFMQMSNENRLPFYWANMIVMGQAEAVELASEEASWTWWAIGGAAFVIALTMFFLFKKRAFKN